VSIVEPESRHCGCEGSVFCRSCRPALFLPADAVTLPYVVQPIVAGKGIGCPPAEVVLPQPFRSRIWTMRVPRRALFGRVSQ
jgi:hypothetical protein